jgi:hypothetical protein
LTAEMILSLQTYVLKLAKSGSDGEKVFLLLESGTRFHTVQVRGPCKHCTLAACWKPTPWGCNQAQMVWIAACTAMHAVRRNKCSPAFGRSCPQLALNLSRAPAGSILPRLQMCSHAAVLLSLAVPFATPFAQNCHLFHTR